MPALVHVGVVTVFEEEEFHELVKSYLKSKGSLPDGSSFTLKGSSFGNAFKDASFHLEDAKVQSSQVREVETEETSLTPQIVFDNSSGTNPKALFEVENLSLEVVQTTLKKFSKLTLGSGVSAKYEGTGVSAGIQYERGSEVEEMEMFSNQLRVPFRESVDVGAGTKMGVRLVNVLISKEIDLHDMVLTFPKDAKVSYKTAPTEWRWKSCKLCEILEEWIDKEHTSKRHEVAVRLSGKYRWTTMRRYTKKEVL